MRLSRRSFNRLAFSTSAGTLLHLAPPLHAQSFPALQPLTAQLERLLTAFEAFGVPLPEATAIRSLLAQPGPDEASATLRLIALLAPHVLLQVTLNPEMRISVTRGGALAELVQGGWRTFLVRVDNHAAATTPLKITSPQGGSMGRRSSLAITGVHDFTNGAVDAVEARTRWIGVATHDAPPMTPTLSGLSLEYRILSLYSRDAGQREASLQADAGFGEQDLGFRSTVPILFRCLPARASMLHLHDEDGAPTTAALLLQDALGRIYPPQTKRAAPDLNFEPQIYRRDGESLYLPDGRYTLTAGRGPEYLRSRQNIEIGPASAPIAVALERWVTPATFGYYSGDTHIHAAGCSHYESPTEGVTPEVMARQVAGEALDLGSVLNWGPGFEYQKKFFTGHAESAHAMHQEDAPPESSALLRYDVEVSGFPSSHCGHLILLRLQQQIYPAAATIDDWPSWNIPILRWAKSQRAITGYAHSAHGLVVDSTALPNFLMPPFNSMGANQFIVDVTHSGLIDFISGCDLWPFAELNIWYHTLNCGFRTAFAGETDFPCITDACVGGGRSYAHLTAPPTGDTGYSAWLEALVRNRSYFGDGRSHLFDFKVQPIVPVEIDVNQDPTLDHPATIRITATVCARLEPTVTPETEKIRLTSPYDKPYWHLERSRIGTARRVRVELIVNGYPVAYTEIEADGKPRPIHFDHPLERSSWIALRIYPSSHTNPRFVTIADQPLRASRRSAAWCREAVDVCWKQKSPRIRPTEQAEAAAAYDHARASYDRILRETPDD